MCRYIVYLNFHHVYLVSTIYFQYSEIWLWFLPCILSFCRIFSDLAFHTFSLSFSRKAAPVYPTECILLRALHVSIFGTMHVMSKYRTASPIILLLLFAADTINKNVELVRFTLLEAWDWRPYSAGNLWPPCFLISYFHPWRIVLQSDPGRCVDRLSYLKIIHWTWSDWFLVMIIILYCLYIIMIIITHVYT